MKKFLFLGFSLGFMILSLSGCTRPAQSKRVPETNGSIDTTNNKPIDKPIEKKKVALDEPLKRINDYVLNQVDLKDPVDLRQIADQLSQGQRSEVEEIIIYDNGTGIRSLQGAEAFENLKDVRIDHSQIRDFEGIEKNLKLEQLTLVNSKIENFNSLPKNLSLIDLCVNYCPLTDVGDLSKLFQLEDLSISGTNISGLDGSNLPHSLRYLGLRETKFKSLRAIESTFPFVEIIDLSHGAIESVEDVQDFGHVQQIGLVGTPVMEKFRDKDGKVPQFVDYKGVTLIFVEPDF